jgi:hypothetical protein
VTTSHFFRPGGASTQNKGVAADIVVATRFNGDDYGERHQPYALPPKTIAEFRGRKVNIGSGSKRWQTVTEGDISALTTASMLRQKTNKELLKVKEDVAKAKKNKGIIKISEILDDPDRKKDDDDDEDEDDKKLSPQTLEGLDILADLIVRKQPNLAMKTGRTETPKSPTP